MILRIAFCVLVFTSVVDAKEKSCRFDLDIGESSGAFVRLVDRLSKEKKVLDADALRAIAESEKPVNPADLFEGGSETEKLAWRKAFGEAMVGGDFKWSEIRECVAARVENAGAARAKRDAAIDATAGVPFPVKVKELPDLRRFQGEWEPQVVDNDGHRTVAMPLQSGGIATIDLETYDVKTYPFSPILTPMSAPFYFERKGKPFALYGNSVIDLTKKEREGVFPVDRATGAGVEDFGKRKIAFVGGGPMIGAAYLYVRSIDGKKTKAFNVYLGRAGAPTTGTVGGQKLIACLDGGGEKLHLVDPLTETSREIKLGIPYKQNGPLTLVDVADKPYAILPTANGFHFIDLKAEKIQKVVKAQIEAYTRAIPFGENLATGATTKGAVVLDLAKQKIAVTIPAKDISSSVVPFVFRGETYLFWGNTQGEVTIAKPSGEVVAKNKVRTTHIYSLVPFEKDGTLLAVAIGNDPPAVIQLIGTKK